MSRRTPGRATRQILSGSQLDSARETIRTRDSPLEPASVTYWYLVVLSVLIVLSALVWAFWGMGAASPVLFVLAVGLVGSWLVL